MDFKLLNKIIYSTEIQKAIADGTTFSMPETVLIRLEVISKKRIRSGNKT